MVLSLMSQISRIFSSLTGSSPGGSSSSGSAKKVVWLTAMILSIAPVFAGACGTLSVPKADASKVLVSIPASGTIVGMPGLGGGTISPLNVGSDPTAMAISPNGLELYVVANGGTQLEIVNLFTRKSLTTLGVGPGAVSVAEAPNNSAVYVANSVANSVTVVPLLGTPRVYGSVKVGSDPVQVVVAPNSEMAYVADHADGTITQINLITEKAANTYDVGGHPTSIALSTNGGFALVTHPSSGSVSITNLLSGQAPADVSVGPDPTSIAVEHATAYVTVAGLNEVVPMNVATGQVGKPIQLPGTPKEITVTPVGNKGFVTLPSMNAVAELNLTSGGGSFVKVIKVPGIPAGLAAGLSNSTIL